MGNGRPSRRDLRALISRATNQPIGLPPDVMQLLGPDLPRMAGRSRTNQLIDGFSALLDMYPAAIEKRARKENLKFGIDKIYKTGEVEGYATKGSRRFAIYADSNLSLPPAGCDCDDSQGEGPCVHGYGFVCYLTTQLKQHGSELRKRVEQQDFDGGKLDRSRFKPNRSMQSLRQLDEIVERELARPMDGDGLPEPVTVVEQRISWDFRRDGEYLELTPMLQQRKKRGDGFTKGRNLSIEKLQNDTSLPLSPIDRKVVAKISVDRDRFYYSRNDYSLDEFDALCELVGADNVTFAGEPIAVKRRPFVLSLVDRKQGLEFLITNEHGEVGVDVPILGNDEAIVAIDQPGGTIYVSRPGGRIAQVAQHLLGMGPISVDHRAALVAKARELQKIVTIRLPESDGGPVVMEAAPMAILLRTRTDGTLDFAIRIRDAAGALRRPGSEPMIRSATREEGTIQIQRLLDDELRRADKAVRALGILVDRENWFGSISDFHAGLSLIEKLQSNEHDIEVLWDKSSEKPLKVLGSLSSRNVRVDISSKRNWFGITGECNFGETTMPLKDLLDGLSAGGDDSVSGDYLKIGDNQWARISKKLQQRLRKLRDATNSDRSTLKLDATAAPVIRELMDTDIEVHAAKAWHKCLDRLERAEKLEPKLPDGLDATLRDYQLDGFKWLRRLAEWGVGGILADDMGLGKTLQTLAVLLDRSADGPSLVIAPTSVGFNWVREAERFSPTLKVHLYRETERGEFLPSVGPNDLVVCSYGLALRDQKSLADVHWNTVVLDEAQAIKNSNSKTSKAIATLQADWFVALTGTPVENHLGELWSLFHVVSPGVFGGWESFRRKFAAPIEKQIDEDARAALADRLKPFVLRRTKKQVLTELPPRTEMNLYVDLSSDERAEYENVRRAALGEIEQIESLPNIQDQRFKILAMLTRLRQISCHVGLVNKNWTQSSAKLDQLCETLESLKEEGHRALVFSQFTQHLALIRAALDAKGFTYEYLDGSTPPDARQKAVDRFQNGTADAFLISLKAGGTGLNLTAADYVIHMDPWWNPAVEDQATDRAHRIGQDKPVMVYRIVARGTIEEEILALHETKRDLVAGVLEGTEAAAKLTNSDLIRMLRQ